MLNDRFSKGLLAGLIAAIAMNLTNLLTHNVLKVSELHILDFASILIHGSKPMNPGELLFALSAQIGFAGVMGMLYAYLIKYLNRKNNILKAIIFSLSIWFMTYAITILFGKIKHIDAATSITNLLATIVYALVLALVLNILETKYPDPVATNDKQRVNKLYRIVPVPAKKIQKIKNKIHIRKPFKIK